MVAKVGSQPLLQVLHQLPHLPPFGRATGTKWKDAAQSVALSVFFPDLRFATGLVLKAEHIRGHQAKIRRVVSSW